MRVEYVCHACVLIDTGDLKIVTDPWFKGPAYCGQWNVFPKPVNTSALSDTDVILLSHGHEDHLHEPTLSELPKSARVFYPYSWYGGTKDYLESMGFDDVREALTYKTYRLSPQTSLTYISNNLDSIMVIESGGRVLVNVNDALHAYPKGVIDFYLNALTQRWPRIDTLLCGFGGASYFPNTVHLEGKDDRAIGAAREQLFAHNFCHITRGLKPRVAVPFAADFALLAPRQRWINEVRFPRAHMKAYYREHFAATGETREPEIYDMYPGDALRDDELEASSPYRAELREGHLTHLIEEQYAAEIAELQRTTFIEERDAEALREAILSTIKERAALFDAATLNGLRFCIRVTDVAEDNCFNVHFEGGKPGVRRAASPAPDAILLMETASRILEYSFDGEWGGDAITIGYGCEIYVFDRKTIEAKLDSVCVRLLTRHPTAKGQLRREPLRAVRYMARNPLLRTWAANRLKGKREENVVYDQSVWMLRTKCEVCQICDLPLLDEKFAAQL